MQVIPGKCKTQLKGWPRNGVTNNICERSMSISKISVNAI